MLQLLAAIRASGGTCAKSEAPKLLARALGFARAGAGIAAVVESLLRSLVRTKQVESRAGQIRVNRAGVAVPDRTIALLRKLRLLRRLPYWNRAFC